jgi:hypothetical protein
LKPHFAIVAMPMASQPKQRPQADGEAARGARPIVQRPAIGLVNVLVTTVSLQLLTGETRTALRHDALEQGERTKSFPKQEHCAPEMTPVLSPNSIPHTADTPVIKNKRGVPWLH